jgi:hypothetical protein
MVLCAQRFGGEWTVSWILSYLVLVPSVLVKYKSASCGCFVLVWVVCGVCFRWIIEVRRAIAAFWVSVQIRTRDVYSSYLFPVDLYLTSVERVTEFPVAVRLLQLCPAALSPRNNCVWHSRSWTLGPFSPHCRLWCALLTLSLWIVFILLRIMRDPWSRKTNQFFVVCYLWPQSASR